MQHAFDTSKKKLAAATVLSHPSANAELVLAVDASNSHVGAVLQQRDKRGALQPLGFFSSKLSAAQVKYSTFDRELLACFLAIRHFRWCLEGRTFCILTDHKPLTFALHRLSDAWTARQQRHLAYVAEFTSDVRHVAGVDNVVADALSRPAASVLPAEGGRIDLKELAAEQASCEETQAFKDRANVQEVQLGSLTLLCDASTGALRPVVPVSLRRTVFNSVHALAHAGARATRRMVTARFVWRRCAADITAWCRDCQSCCRGKVTQQEHTTVEPIPIPDKKFSHVHLDLVGPLPPSKRGHTYLLTIIDRTTRWPEVCPLSSITAQECADAFVDSWVSRFGVPAVLTTDRGTQFTGATWKSLCSSLGIKHVTTTAFHPQSNGMVERFHRQLKESLRARCGGKDWLEHLPWVLLGLRAAPKEEANVSTAEATLGAQLLLPCQPPLRALDPVPAPTIPSTVRTYADVARGRSARLEVAQFVYVRTGQSSSPLAPTYAGPYRVLEVRDKTVLLQLGERQDWISVDRIKTHVGEAPVIPAQPPPRGRPRKENTEDSV